MGRFYDETIVFKRGILEGVRWVWNVLSQEVQGVKTGLSESDTPGKQEEVGREMRIAINVRSLKFKDCQVVLYGTINCIDVSKKG